ncbi:hypothetical protein GCM10022237_10170 [Nocardioides ginsengisoli]|uniref:Flagellar hook-length control protein FliK n=1 Tax=Nocardioides ginsengisoli TaxID=363868 RepID=A0ABW3W8B7_9ACTN
MSITPSLPGTPSLATLLMPLPGQLAGLLPELLADGDPSAALPEDGETPASSSFEDALAAAFAVVPAPVLPTPVAPAAPTAPTAPAAVAAPPHHLVTARALPADATTLPDAAAPSAPGVPAAAASVPQERPATPDAPAPASPPLPLVTATTAPPIVSAGPSEPDVELSVVRQVFPEVTQLVATTPTDRPGTHRITLTLQPEQLGEVRVTLVVRDGSVHVRLAGESDNAAVHRALATGAPELQRILERSGATQARVLVREVTAVPFTVSANASASPTASPVTAPQAPAPTSAPQPVTPSQDPGVSADPGSQSHQSHRQQQRDEQPPARSMPAPPDLPDVPGAPGGTEIRTTPTAAGQLDRSL